VKKILNRQVAPLMILAAMLAAAYGCMPPPRRQPSGAPVPTIEARFLLPEQDNLGRPFDPELFKWVEDDLARRFGGWTYEGLFPGGWNDGRRIVREQSRRYLIAIDRAKVDELKTFLKQVKERFHQKSLYLSFTQCEVVYL